MSMHPIQCKCGALRGQVDLTGVNNRLICYCSDCRAFATFLGSATDVLDQHGGTEIVQVAQARLRFLQGEDRLAAVRLSEKGLVRWYASCCNTPLGNTLPQPQVSIVGLVHAALDHSRLSRDFGTKIAIVNVASASGDRKPTQRGLAGVFARAFWIVVTARFRGEYKRSPFFTTTGQPRVVPTILSPQELARLKTSAQHLAESG